MYWLLDELLDELSTDRVMYGFSPYMMYFEQIGGELHQLKCAGTLCSKNFSRGVVLCQSGSISWIKRIEYEGGVNQDGNQGRTVDITQSITEANIEKIH